MALGFTEDQVRRYSRHIILRQVGGKGQRRLLGARVLLVGTGGLGSPAGLYLGAAGVGKIGVADFDRVDLSNLHRQVFHRTRDIGQPKTASAARTLHSMNPDIEVVEHQLELGVSNIGEILDGYDIVVDGSDNFPTRYLVNDACVMAGKPLVHGSISQFRGMATVFLPGQGCYRCLFPQPPAPGTTPTCQEAGVLGVLPGVIGTIQAVETIKLILEIGRSLVGRLLIYDALEMEFLEVRWKRDAGCPVCGDHPTITELFSYGPACPAPAP
ncbi:MAG: molybdopterin-synthase adenylyltransferase MoeB [Dehalococcoidia bacterium]